MPRSRLSVIGLAGALALAACSSASDSSGAVTADEAQQLNDAAAMLDANSVDLNAVATDDTEIPPNSTEPESSSKPESSSRQSDQPQ